MVLHGSKIKRRMRQKDTLFLLQHSWNPWWSFDCWQFLEGGLRTTPKQFFSRAKDLLKHFLLLKEASHAARRSVNGKPK